MNLIHVVDDDFHLRRQLQSFLEAEGYRAVSHESIDSILENLQETPDLILVDMHMPRGLELAQLLAQQGVQIPLVYLIEIKQQKALDEGLASGVQEYLLKPIEPNELRAMLQRHLKTEVAAQSSHTRYQFESALGEGGVARVFRALDLHTQKPVAIKKWFLPDSLQGAQRKLFIDTFQREASTLQKLKHPALVDTLDAYVEDDACYLVMAYLSEPPLSDWATSPGPTLGQFLELFLKSADALSHAHQYGLVHRDIKPENIRVDAQGQPHITDFEVTVFADWAARQAEPVLGSTTYLSPEQLQALPQIDARSDIYSLAAVAYHLLTGQLCFDGATISERIERMFLGDLDLPHMLNPNIHVGLSALICQALCLDLDQRYNNMQSFYEGLKKLLDAATEAELAQPLLDFVI